MLNADCAWIVWKRVRGESVEMWSLWDAYATRDECLKALRGPVFSDPRDGGGKVLDTKKGNSFTQMTAEIKVQQRTIRNEETVFCLPAGTNPSIVTRPVQHE